MIGWSFQISTSTLSLFSIVAAVAGQLLQGLSLMSFSLLVQLPTQCLSELASTAFSPHMLLRHLWISTGLVPSTIRNSVTTLSLIYMSTTFTILLCYCVAHMWLTGAPMILVELGSVTIWYARQETLSGAIFKMRGGEEKSLLLYWP
jgi:hypothetical protein